MVGIEPLSDANGTVTLAEQNAGGNISGVTLLENPIFQSRVFGLIREQQGNQTAKMIPYPKSVGRGQPAPLMEEEIDIILE